MPYQVTIKAVSATKVYDGTPLTKNSYQESGLREGDSIASIKITGSQTTVGISNNVPSAAVIEDADGAVVTDEYEITYENGTLEVTQNMLLDMLKIDLGISVAAYDTRLVQYLTVSKDAIIDEGATTLNDTVLDDMQLIVMYAGWLWRKRDFSAGKYGQGTRMPDMLRYKLNNRIFKEKMGDSNV